MSETLLQCRQFLRASTLSSLNALSKLMLRVLLPPTLTVELTPLPLPTDFYI